MAKLSKSKLNSIHDCIKHYEEHRHLFDGFASSVHDYLRNDSELLPYIQFSKYRLKSSDRLRAKLVAKCEANEKPSITPANLFQRINDLAGIRLLHLHLDQIGDINKHIGRILAAHSVRIIEGPTANCWDVEYENHFRRLGIATKDRSSMYTSVHYVLEANERTKITFELQVRTLAEELWGEISHRVAYEDEEPDQSTADHLKVLARMTSGATRLVDLIFRDAEARRKPKG